MKSTLTNGVGCEGWMSELPDNVLLSKLSIPGTHNSMSYTCYEANIILKIISGLSKLGKDRLAELVSQIMALLLWDWICRQMPCLYSINSWKNIRVKRYYCVSNRRILSRKQYTGRGLRKRLSISIVRDSGLGIRAIQVPV